VANTLAPFLGDFHTMTDPERICSLCVTGSDVDAQKLLQFDPEQQSIGAVAQVKSRRDMSPSVTTHIDDI
jgi:hypothetical protein